MKKREKRAYARNYADIVWNHSLTPEAPKEERAASGPYLMPDIKEFVAPGMKPISSRSQLREYEKSTGTRQVGNDLSLNDFNVAARPPRIDQRKMDDAVGKAIERVMG